MMRSSLFGFPGLLTAALHIKLSYPAEIGVIMLRRNAT